MKREGSNGAENGEAARSWDHLHQHVWHPRWSWGSTTHLSEGFGEAGKFGDGGMMI
jgi:hypothetical protein